MRYLLAYAKDSTHCRHARIPTVTLDNHSRGELAAGIAAPGVIQA